MPDDRPVRCPHCGDPMTRLRDIHLRDIHLRDIGPLREVWVCGCAVRPDDRSEP